MSQKDLMVTFLRNYAGYLPLTLANRYPPKKMPKRKGTYGTTKMQYLSRRMTGPLPYSRSKYHKRVKPTLIHAYPDYSRVGGRFRNLRTGGFLGLERKFLDCVWNSVVINTSTDGSGLELQPTSGCTNAISIPGQGDGEQQRDGRKYTLKSAWFSGVVSTTQLQDQADVIDFHGYFFAMVLDTQANAATLVSENVYINPGSTGVNLLPQPLRNLQNSKRYRILDSKYVPVGGAYAGTDGASTSTISNQVSPRINLSWSGTLICDSVGTNADVASASDNAIHILALAGGTGLTPVMIGKSRVRFYG